ncbi:putative serine proteinase inhibitor 2-like protein [BeAn 58058 virus]|uniref:putative serine proteinase inhibitor 2-like protein n=1 Tax=BeAn 58058 virus TaxID=67082 RepID=UPI00090BA215|nr:putative serine proteinase inhibitor 2-like protein [BeAn 58058 virus]APG58379.1 putative serine proteinase inhibitor 2-like protein [BeAn 58058 virus]
MRLNDEVLNYNHVEELFGNFSVIELPYIGNASMVVILPDEIDGLYNIEQNITDDYFNNLCKNLIPAFVDVSLPKFKVSGNYNLINILSKLGLEDVFNSKGDFSNMYDSTINIDEFIHKTYIDVSEKYTEAAAATCMLMSDCGRTKVFCVNHPFMYVIKDTSNKILFVGRLVYPTSDN